MQVEPDGTLLRVGLVGTGTAPGPVPVHVDVRDDAGWTELSCTVTEIAPGATTSTGVTVPPAAAPREIRVRTTTDVVELAVPAPEPGPTSEPTDATTPTHAPTSAPDPAPTVTPTPAPTTEHPETPTPERTGTPTGPTTGRATTGKARTDASVPLHARIPGTPSAPGTLRLTIGDGAATLGEPERLADRWHLTGSLPSLTVEDGRAHAAGWTVSVQGTGLAGPGATLGAERLGWSPAAPARPGLAVGPDVAGVLSGGPGLAEPAVLATARGAARHGPVELGAELDLETPLDTPPGDYAGTLTVTLFPVD